MKSKMFLTLLNVLLAVMLISPSAEARKAKIEKGKIVKFDYTLTIDDEVVETSEGKQPLEYTHGEGQIIAGLSKELEGLKRGDKKTITVAPEDGYGTINPKAFGELPLTSFPDNFNPQIGMVINMQFPDNEHMAGVIWQIKEESVVINFNHPLAGKALQYDVKIVSVE